jgi:hypothetical protein
MLDAGIKGLDARVAETSRVSARTTTHESGGKAFVKSASSERTFETRASMAVVRAIRRTEKIGSVGAGSVVSGNESGSAAPADDLATCQAEKIGTNTTTHATMTLTTARCVSTVRR